MYFLYFSYVIIILICDNPSHRDFVEKLHNHGFLTDIRCKKARVVSLYFMFAPAEIYCSYSLDNSITTIVEDKVIKFCKKSNMSECEAYGYNKNYKKTTLEGKTLRVLTHEQKNIFEVEKTPNGCRLNDNVYLSKFLLLLSKGLKFNFEIDCSGFFTKFISFEIPTDKKIEEESRKYVTPPISESPPIFVIRAARSLDKSRALIMPFSKMVWVGICISIPVVTFCLIGFSRIEAKFRRKKSPKLFRITWLTIDSFLRQDTNVDSLEFATIKITMGIWLLMAFVLTTGYLSILPSFLMFPGKEVIPENFVELSEAVKRGKYIIGTLHDSPEFWILAKGIRDDVNWNDLMKTLSESMLSSVLKNSIEGERKALQRVLEGNFALITTEHLIKPEVMKMGSEKFFISTDILFSSYDYIRMSGRIFKNVDDLNKMVNIIHQTGMMRKYYSDQLEEARREKEFYSVEDNIYEEQLKVEHIMSVIYILLTGYCISFIVFLCEVIVHVCKKRSAKKRARKVKSQYN